MYIVHSTFENNELFAKNLGKSFSSNINVFENKYFNSLVFELGCGPQRSPVLALNEYIIAFQVVNSISQSK